MNTNETLHPYRTRHMLSQLDTETLIGLSEDWYQEEMRITARLDDPRLSAEKIEELERAAAAAYHQIRLISLIVDAR